MADEADTSGVMLKISRPTGWFQKNISRTRKAVWIKATKITSSSEIIRIVRIPPNSGPEPSTFRGAGRSQGLTSGTVAQQATRTGVGLPVVADRDLAVHQDVLVARGTL